MTAVGAKGRAILTRWPILRRLPLVGMVGLAAWFISTSHGEHILVRYRLAGDRSVSGLKTEIMREGRLYRSAEWRYDRGAPDEQLQELELPPGDYTVEVQALGRRGPDPKPVPLRVDRDGPHQALVGFP